MLSAFLLSSSLHANFEEILHVNDFSGDTVGSQPTGFNFVLPSANRGMEDALPIAWQLTDGAVGALIVGNASQPQSGLAGTGNQSLRIYDYTSSGTDSRVYLGQNFVANEVNNRFDVRLDLSFQRSHPYAMDPNFPGDRLLIALGSYAPGQTFNSNINRAVQISLTNEGEWTASGGPEVDPDADPIVDPGVGSYLAEGENDLTIVANAHPTDPLDYDGPAGLHSLAPFTYSLYINGARVADGFDFQHQMQLGKFGFVTGFNNEAVNVDLVVDDIVVTGLREMEFVEFELDLVIDFEQFTEGTRPAGFTRAAPGTPVGPTELFPIAPSAGGPHGTLIVDANSSPAPSFNGKGVRLYDYHTGGRAKLSHVFLPDDETVPHVRVDFSFRRSVAMVSADGNPGQGMIFGLGAPSTDQTLHVNAGRALNVNFSNDGTMQVAGNNFLYEPFDQIGTNDISVFTNSDEAEITYEGPDGGIHVLNGGSFAVFANGVIVATNAGIKSGFPVLGKFAFSLGQSSANTHIDFVVDDIRVSDFGGPIEPPEPAVLRIGKGVEPDSFLLSWDSSNNETYGLEQSTDLVDWEPTGATFTGDGAPIEHPVTVNSALRRFFRLISPVEIIPPGTLATLTTSHEVRLWTNVVEGNAGGLDPALVGTHEYVTGSANQIGKSGPSDQQRLRISIQGFQLPVLEGAVESATYTLAKTGSNSTPAWGAQIYIFDPSVTPSNEVPEDVFYSGAEADQRSWMRAIALDAFNNFTVNGPIEFTLTAADLAGFYNPDGTPASADGMIWFRVNPGAAPEDIANFQRLEIEPRLDQPNSPTLRVIAVE